MELNQIDDLTEKTNEELIDMVITPHKNSLQQKTKTRI